MFINNTLSPNSGDFWFGDPSSWINIQAGNITGDRLLLTKRHLRRYNFTKTTTTTCSYATADYNTFGSDVTYTSDLTNGDSISINKDGLYSITAQIFSNSYTSNDKNNYIDINIYEDSI